MPQKSRSKKDHRVLLLTIDDILVQNRNILPDSYGEKRFTSNAKMLRTLVVALLLPEVTFGILNGLSVSPSETRSLVKLSPTFSFYAPDEFAVCGGVLISQTVVLTAAHCVMEEKEYSPLVDVTMIDYHPEAPEKKKLAPSEFIEVFSGFDDNVRGDKDVGFVFIPKTWKCRNSSGPHVARLPPQILQKAGLKAKEKPITDKEIEKAECYALGWGMTEDEGYATKPQRIYLHVERDIYIGLLGYPVNSTKACQGDSGSPVYCSIRGRKYLIGVMTDVGAFSPVELGRDDNINCEKYEFVIIADIRASAQKIIDILKTRNEVDRMLESQKNCVEEM
ncbi:unnamed protein product [Cylicocyclus nassatus]|uniref:Peptidase S1 domain-containing protein n=1 Tax=Cylicocyclus nassatus TaxID=53992 RepID=A0AA36H5Q3_CYLNA|nr:unnamed protein product [Cylicocyclus nassatus]